ncbi:hypothetical protein DGWBC_1576 [Dehalogenimonas sp. WBC-2]|nr:hypothetical protein DGWBC_1576 [Dehalogenimonas sp. WBC-2]
MAYQPRTLNCCDCGSDFTFSVEDQEFFASKGFVNEPKRCPSCRTARKAERGSSNGGSSFGGNGGGYNSAPRQMFPAVCSDCGKATQVPFEPRNGKPVYCSDCYRRVSATR